jgi:hypothetical protein
MSASNYVHLDVELIVQETDDALLLRVDGEDYWIPKSQIADVGDYAEGDENATVSISEWIAGKKGLV